MVIEQAMYFLLGFLTMGFVGLMLLPVYWRRALRLTRRDMETRLPLSMSDIIAERDALRAELAVQLRGMEMNVEKTLSVSATNRIALEKQSVALIETRQLLASTQAELSDCRNSFQIADRERRETQAENAAIQIEITQAHAACEQLKQQLRVWQANHQQLHLELQDQLDMVAQLQRRLEALQAARTTESEGYRQELQRLQDDIRLLQQQTISPNQQDLLQLRAMVLQMGQKVAAKN